MLEGAMAVLRVFMMLCILTLNYYRTEGRLISMNENMDAAGKELLCKPRELTFIPNEFSCIDIYKQPAFSHPSLKDHKIQLKPSFMLGGDVKTNENPSIKPFEHGLDSGGCPAGTVPIGNRIHHGNDSFHRLTKTLPGQHFAVVRDPKPLKAPFHGVRGLINVRDLQLQDFQVSASQLWVQNGPPSQLNSIQVGWEANPILYGNSHTYITAFWTADNYGETGCYNTVCPGFVQVNPRPVLGTQIQGAGFADLQHCIDLQIKQDKTSGNWWLIVEGNVSVGYWPKQLFNHLGEGATLVQYGGWTVNIPNTMSPPMGSGHFANTNDSDSAFISQMKLINGGYGEASPDFLEMEIYTDDESCYSVYYDGYGGEVFGHVIFFGGPGGSCTN